MIYITLVKFKLHVTSAAEKQFKTLVGAIFRVYMYVGIMRQFVLWDIHTNKDGSFRLGVIVLYLIGTITC